MAKAMAGNGGVAVEMEATRLQVCRLQRGFGWRGFYSFGLEARRREISEDTLNSCASLNLTLGGGCGDEEVMAKAMAGNGGVAVEMEATRLQVCRLQRGFGWRRFYSFELEARRREIY